MRIETPSLRADGFKVDLNTGYGNPWGDILLTKDGRTRLQWANEDDCDQIIKAAAELKSQIIASRTRAAAPHGREHLHKDRCQLCGKPEDDELHGPPAPVITDSERTCPENNPESGLWCYRGGGHGVHRDADGEEWRTDGLVVAEPACSFIREYDGQIYPCVLGDDHAEHQDRLGARWWHGDDDSQTVTHAAPKKAGK